MLGGVYITLVWGHARMTNKQSTSLTVRDRQRLAAAIPGVGDSVVPLTTGVRSLPYGAIYLELPSSIARRWGGMMLRGSLALIFIWFGTLKVTGMSPVAPLLRATLPWFGGWIVPLIGGIEIMLGIGLLIKRAWPLVLLGLTGHLAGTFLTFIDAHSLMYLHGDPLLLTADGEFVLKNLILISGALMLLGTAGLRHHEAQSFAVSVAVSEG